MSKIRVLHVLNGLGSGGAESFIMSVYRNINRDELQFDFLIRDTSNNILYDEILSLGGKIYISPNFPRNIISNYLYVERFFKEHTEYKIVHVHANSLLYLKPLSVAKKNGVKCRIIHSHNTQTANRKLYRLIHQINKYKINKYSNVNLACSHDAGKWMFNSGFSVVKNAINVDNFSFNIENRNLIRDQFNLQKKFVIGHVGRFTDQKNHNFIIDIFMEILKINADAVLFLVGVGELKESIEKRIRKLGIADKIVFTENRKDVNSLMSAMDVFLLPSKFEGLGIVLIEAQASGLHCFTSEHVVPKDVDVTELLQHISLKRSPNYWANEIIKWDNNYERNNMSDQIKEAGFDIEIVAKELEDMYKYILEN